MRLISTAAATLVVAATLDLPTASAQDCGAYGCWAARDIMPIEFCRIVI